MEVAIVLGSEPVSTIAAATPLPRGVSEVEFAGGMRGEPVELIKCETVDLEVPASSEIVIEGEIRPKDSMVEGPFGEWTGYMAGERAPRLVIRVKAITFRNDPIFTMSCLGVPVDDNSILCLTNAAAFLEALQDRGYPVTGVFTFPESGHILTVVSVRNAYPGIGQHVAQTVFSTHGAYMIPYVVIVEDDVDPSNLNQVLHAICTKCHPIRGIVKLDRTPTSSLLPFLNAHEQQNNLGAKAYFDCLWEWDRGKTPPQRVSFNEVYPPEIQQKTIEMWQKYGH
jgi:4-hydroxy-3-polyprenylbenzoate decarboxylase